MRKLLNFRILDREKSTDGLTKNLPIDTLVKHKKVLPNG